MEQELIGKEALWFESGRLHLVSIEDVISETDKLEIEVKTVARATSDGSVLTYTEHLDATDPYFTIMGSGYCYPHWVSKYRLHFRRVGSLFLSPNSIDLFKNRETNLMVVLDFD